MRRYDDPVEVRRGQVGEQGEGPAQFLWHGQLWKVSAIVARWVETGPWWKSAELSVSELAEHEVWRVEAGRGLLGRGVFDLLYDWSSGDWRLTRCLD